MLPVVYVSQNLTNIFDKNQSVLAVTAVTVTAGNRSMVYLNIKLAHSIT